MKRLFIISYCFFLLLPLISSQEADKPSIYNVSALGFYKSEIGQSYRNFIYNGGGLSLLATKKIFKSEKKSFLIGVYDMMTYGTGTGFIDGGTGFSRTNKLGTYLGYSRYISQSKVFLNFGIYSGWEYIYRKGQITIPNIIDNEAFMYSKNQFSIDLEFKSGFRLSEKFSLIASTIFNCSKLLDFDGVLEYPFYSLGVGIEYNL